MSNSLSISLYVSENSDDCPVIFTLPEGVDAFAGNLLEYEGEFFPVKEVIFIQLDSAEYRLIRSLCSIRRATAVYSLYWSAENG
jgi:hypothetical protein